MRILIPRVPPSTTSGELFRLADSVLSRKPRIPFKRQTQIAACRIIKIEDSRGIVEYFGLLELTSDKLGRWFLANFKNQQIRNKRIYAREFVARGPDHPAFSPENDRRRPDLKLEKVTDLNIQVEGDAEFVRVNRALECET